MSIVANVFILVDLIEGVVEFLSFGKRLSKLTFSVINHSVVMISKHVSLIARLK